MLRTTFQTYKPYFIVVIVPVLFTIILGGMFSPIFVRNVPVQILDMDQSVKSRQIVDYFYDSRVIEVSETARSLDEIEDMLLGGETCGAVIIPEGFGADLQGKKGAEALVYLDNANFMFGNTIMSEVSTIFETVKAGVQIQYLEAGNQTPYQALQSVYTMNLVDRTLYNPQLAYFYFLAPGLLAVFSQQTYLIGVATILIEEKAVLRRLTQRVGWDYLRAGFRLMLTRFTLLAFLSMATNVACIAICMHLTGMPMRGHIFTVLVLQSAFLYAITGPAIVIAAIFEQVAHVAQFTMFLTIPTFLLSGYAWPTFLMAPGLEKVMNFIWPLCYFAPPMRDIILKGVDLNYIAPYVVRCVAFGAFWVNLGILFYRRKVIVARRVVSENGWTA